MQVVPFFHSFSAGGAESYCRVIASDLVHRGHTVIMVTSLVGPREPPPAEGFEIYRLPLLSFPPRPPWLLGLGGLLGELSGCDIVDAHTPYPTIVHQALQCASYFDVPLVVTHHNDFQYVNQLVSQLTDRIWMQPALQRTTRIIATTESYARTSPVLRDHLFKTSILPLCHDFRKFSAREKGLVGDYLLYVGRLIWYKNIWQIIKVLEILRNDFPWLRLLIAGKGPARTSLESLVANSPVRANVEFLGYLDESDLASTYQGALATLLPSLSRREAFGVSLIESMACGTPVVAYEIPGVSEVVTRSRGGLLARPGDIGQLAELVRLMLIDESMRTNLGEAGSRNVRELFSVDQVVPELLSVYSAAVGDFDS